MKCRFCQSDVDRVFVDLGHQPPSNAYLTAEQLDAPEITYPLRVYVCENCWLVQLPEHAHASELFTDSYAYFSSVSTTWVEHARKYVESVIPRFNLGSESLVVEIASNDGYLLQFVKQAGIPCVGVEPTASTAGAARRKGIETVEAFFGAEFARRFVQDRASADLVIANNVLAHVPDLNDFVAGVASILRPFGVATFEFPHLQRLVECGQFDTIYHEHFSYFSFTTVCSIFERYGLQVFDVQELSTHGGSLRVFVQSKSTGKQRLRDSASALIQAELAAGMSKHEWYACFQDRVDAIKNDLVKYLIAQKESGKLVAGYGAAAKGNTLMNYAGIRGDLVAFVADAAESKQGKYLPGSHIPITSPDVLIGASADVVLVLPWNIASEVTDSLAKELPPGCEFVTAIPCLRELV